MQSSGSLFLTDDYELTQQALWDFQNSLFICSIAKVTKVTDKTVSIQPLVNYFDKNNGFKPMLELDEVPVFQLWTKTASIQFPVIAGDTGIVLWFDREIEEALKNAAPTIPSSGNLNNAQACVFIPFLSASAPSILKAEDGLILNSTTKMTATSTKEVSISGKDKITIAAEKNLTITSKDAMNLSTDNSFSLSAKQSMSLESSQAGTIKAGQKLTATGTAGIDLQGGGVSLPDTLKQMAQDAQTFAQALSSLTSPPLTPVGAAAAAWLPTLVAAITKLQTFKG